MRLNPRSCVLEAHFLPVPSFLKVVNLQLFSKALLALIRKSLKAVCKAPCRPVNAIDTAISYIFVKAMDTSSSYKPVKAIGTAPSYISVMRTTLWRPPERTWSFAETVRLTEGKKELTITLSECLQQNGFIWLIRNPGGVFKMNDDIDLTGTPFIINLLYQSWPWVNSIHSYHYQKSRLYSYHSCYITDRMLIHHHHHLIFWWWRVSAKKMEPFSQAL